MFLFSTNRTPTDSKSCIKMSIFYSAQGRQLLPSLVAKNKFVENITGRGVRLQLLWITIGSHSIAKVVHVCNIPRGTLAGSRHSATNMNMLHYNTIIHVKQAELFHSRFWQIQYNTTILLLHYNTHTRVLQMFRINRKWRKSIVTHSFYLTQVIGFSWNSELMLQVI